MHQVVGARRWLALLIVFLVAGCGGGVYTKPAEEATVALRDDKAVVIFMRSSFFGSAISASLFDISDTSNKLIAIIATGEKVAYYVDPGERQFMVVSESADFMDAQLEAGKVYYAIVTPRMGVWRARFSLHPFKQVAGESEFQLDSPELVEWLNDCHFVGTTEEAHAWARSNADSIQSKRFEYMAKWKTMAPQDKKWRTLEPQDGLTNPL